MTHLLRSLKLYVRVSSQNNCLGERGTNSDDVSHCIDRVLDRGGVYYLMLIAPRVRGSSRGLKPCFVVSKEKPGIYLSIIACWSFKHAFDVITMYSHFSLCNINGVRTVLATRKPEQRYVLSVYSLVKFSTELYKFWVIFFQKLENIKYSHKNLIILNTSLSY